MSICNRQQLLKLLVDDDVAQVCDVHAYRQFGKYQCALCLSWEMTTYIRFYRRDTLIDGAYLCWSNHPLVDRYKSILAYSPTHHQAKLACRSFSVRSYNATRGPCCTCGYEEKLCVYRNGDTYMCRTCKITGEDLLCWETMIVLQHAPLLPEIRVRIVGLMMLNR